LTAGFQQIKNGANFGDLVIFLVYCLSITIKSNSDIGLYCCLAGIEALASWYDTTKLLVSCCCNWYRNK